MAAVLRLPTPPTLFGLALRHDGIDAVVTLSVGPGPAAGERSRLESVLLSLEGIGLIALMEPVIATGRTGTPPVAITARDSNYELRVVSPTAPTHRTRAAGLLLPRARLLQ